VDFGPETADLDLAIVSHRLAPKRLVSPLVPRRERVGALDMTEKPVFGSRSR